MKNIIKSISVICMLLVVSISLFGCTDTSASKVYSSFTTLATSNTKMFTNGKLDINFDEEIILRIHSSSNEKYRKLVDIYLPITEISMQFYNNNNLYLNEFSEEISGEESQNLYNKFKDFKQAVEDCENSVLTLESHKNIFLDTGFEQSSVLANSFDSLYLRYDRLIESALKFNNQFVEIYNAKYPMFDFRDASNEITSADIKTLYDYSVSRILDIAFSLKDTDTTYLNTILNAVATYTANSEEVNFLNIINSADKKAEMKTCIAVMQNNLDIFLVQKQNYYNALEKIKANDKDEDIYEEIVNEFKQEIYTDVVNSFTQIVNMLIIE